MFGNSYGNLTLFDELVLFQYNIRRKIIESVYRFFPKLIVLRIKIITKKSISNNEFIRKISSYFKYPDLGDISSEERNAIIGQANKIINGVYDVLGSDEVILDPVVWHTDIKTGFNWDVGKFYKKYKQVDINNNADVKVPRELSRSHHLLTLALAYSLTQQEIYAKKCIDQIENWIEENPLMYSINWR